jgi:hypothetical protein
MRVFQFKLYKPITFLLWRFLGLNNRIKNYAALSLSRLERNRSETNHLWAAEGERVSYI